MSNSTTGDGTILVPPGVWEETSHAPKRGNRESDDIKAALMITLDDLMEALGGFAFVQGAVNLARAVADFSSNIELSLGCVSVDLSVVASGLQVASNAFINLDRSLATTFASLESQMAYFTTDTTLIISHVPVYTPLHMTNVASSSGDSNIFSHIWHDVRNWGSDVFHGTDSVLSAAGAPAWLAVGGAALVLGGYYVVAGISTAGAVAVSAG